MKVEINISRLGYLLALYRMDFDELLGIISRGLKKSITKNDIVSRIISINHLKRIDKVFNKGIYYYLDPKPLIKSKEASIFFRKKTFNSNLNIGAKKIVNKFEELKISLSAISKLAEIDNKREIPIFKVNDNPEKIANKLRYYLYPEFFSTDLKEFLKSLISEFAKNNILVFEFVETWNKKEKANIDGFFINPNVIIIKRQQKSFRREIFTLIHELGHYLIDSEEIEEVDFHFSPSKIEKWCNDFAYYFLAGDYHNELMKLNEAKPDNDYHFDIINMISKNTHLSKLSLFTKLLYLKKISKSNYNKIKIELNEKFLQKEEEKREAHKLEKELGLNIKGSVPKPILSPLFVKTLQIAYHEGVINEYDFCKQLNIKPEKIDKFIQ